MQTVTVSLRMPRAEVAALDRDATQVGVERSTFLKWAIARGTDELLFERACQAYRRKEATLSRAAEMARISLHDMILRLQSADLELNYGVHDLEKDLQA